MKKIFFLICITLCIATGVSKAQYTDLLDFNGINGSAPYGSLTLSGSVLYGMSGNTIFSINTDGTGYAKLFDFIGPNGAAPMGSLTLAGNVLYGTTSAGGATGFNAGTIFSINTDGSGFNTLFNFDSINGAYPRGTLTLSGNILYGVTQWGAQGWGNIFSINTDGTGFTDLFDFNSTGGNPHNSDLTISGNVLYGTTQADQGGMFYGIFSINTDGTGYNHLYALGAPIGNLTLVGNVLYGETESGGTNSNGSIFSINTDGTGYTDLHSFYYGITSYPTGTLALSAGVFYGMTNHASGTSGIGTVFSVNIDGSGYQTLLDFNGINGKDPLGALIISGGVLYGMATQGGPDYVFNGNNGLGLVFSLNSVATGINGAQNAAGMNVFPNPANTIFTISYQSSSPSNLTLTATDSNGKLIYSDNQVGFSGQYLKTIDLSGQPQGVYFIEIIYGGQKQSKKIVSI